jgi:hypothetical protein
MDFLKEAWKLLNMRMSLFTSIPILFGIVTQILFEIIRKLDAFKDALGSKRIDLIGFIIIWSIVVAIIIISHFVLFLNKSYKASSVYRFKRRLEVQIKHLEKQLELKDVEIASAKIKIAALDNFYKEEKKDYNKKIEWYQKKLEFCSVFDSKIKDFEKGASTNRILQLEYFGSRIQELLKYFKDNYPYDINNKFI